MSQILTVRLGLVAAVAGAVAAAAGAEPSAGDPEEFRVKRQEVFEFTEKPKVTRKGDQVTIGFESKGFCDATVAIENAEGRIVRHLASGLLGPKAPGPLQKSSLKQTVVWDGKDDQGVYLDDKDALTVRVSLGLKPQFEKNLLWSPHRRISNHPPFICAAPEGVYVCEGLGVDHLRLFDHDGSYLRTVYPFPAGKLDQVLGLEWHEYPHDGRKWPVKHGFVQGSLLSSGTSGMDDACKHHGGEAATTMAVRNGRIALAYACLNRLATDGSSGGLPLKGPQVHFTKTLSGSEGYGGTILIGPASSAFSPDAKTVYLTGYVYRQTYPGTAGCYQGVYRLEYEKGDPPKVFLGQMDENKYGADNKSFSVCTSVATDAQGRVYVSDFMNDRIQIFSAEGQHLKTLPTPKPAKVAVHQKTGEIYAFSWPAMGVAHEIQRKTNFDVRSIKPNVTRFGPFDKPDKLQTYPLPIGNIDFGGMLEIGQLFSVELDSWSDPPRLWLVGLRHRVTRAEAEYWGGGSLRGEAADPWMNQGILVLELEGDKWVTKRDFAEEAKKALVRVKPPDFSRQRLIFNPKEEKLYVADDAGFAKSFCELIQVDPETGKIKLLPLPFDPEDLGFDQNGLAYLRTDTIVARYDTVTWREVPWDYGEERREVAFCGVGGKSAKVISGLATPGCRPVCFHQGGLAVSPQGHIAVSCTNFETAPDRSKSSIARAFGVTEAGRAYAPMIYPGRARWQELHIWDKHGRIVRQDAVPGLTLLCGVGLDRDDNLYVLADSTRAFGGRKYWNEMTGTLIKFPAGKGRLVSARRGAIPLSADDRPKRPPEVDGGVTGAAWVSGAEWLFGAAGWFGFNTARAGGGCDCWHSRFTLDYFARSFVPEVERYSVAVLDSAGNVITRIGRYGNVDDGVALASGRPGQAPVSPAARSIGGDEVGLFHAAYLGVHTDRRLFIHDAGNGRVLSVRLGYHAESKVALKDVPDQARK